MPFNTNLPTENTDPWYAPLTSSWAALKVFVNGLETSLGLKANAADLGTAAAQNSTAFASSAQGAKADSAVQPVEIAGLVSDADVAGLGTVGWGRAVFIANGGVVPPGTPAYTIVIEASA